MEKFPTNFYCYHHFQKCDLCVSLLFVHVLKVGTPTLKVHLNPSRKVAPTLCAVYAGTSRMYCSMLKRSSSRLLGSGIVAVVVILAASPKPVVQWVEFRTVRTSLLTATSLVD